MTPKLVRFESWDSAIMDLSKENNKNHNKIFYMYYHVDSRWTIIDCLYDYIRMGLKSSRDHSGIK